MSGGAVDEGTTLRLRIETGYRNTPAQLRGLLLIVVSAFGFSAMHAMIRSLTAQLHPFEVAFFRNVFGLLALSPALLHYGLAPLATQRLRLHALRGALGIGAMLLFFSALRITPLAKVTALSFTAPLFATAGAVLFLGETIHTRRLGALLVGFAGAMIVVRPDVTIDAGAVMLILSALFWAASLLVIKSLSGTDSSLTITLYMSLFLVPLSLLPALAVWTPPTSRDYLWLAVMGVTGTLSHLVMTQAFRETDATAVLPADFTRLIWASLLGFLFFGEKPEVATWIGGTLIFGSTTYIAVREARSAAKARRTRRAALAEAAAKAEPPSAA